jgi:RNA polymerase sigma factor (sigma-70 family)
MQTVPLDAAVAYLRRRTAPAAAPNPGDPELLERFIASRDEPAFAALVQRHGPGVLGVCQRMLANYADAEDAFQAVFVVLARRAASVKRRESIGSFLYSVAVRIARRARNDRAIRCRRERQVAAVTPLEATPESVWSDLRPILDEEVSRLPEWCREPLRLCYLDGRTYDEAARVLGCSKGTVASRLSRARERLRVQLLARGVAPGAALLTAVLVAHATPAAVPASLQAAAVRIVTRVGGGAGSVTPRVLELAEGAARTLTPAKLKVVLALLLATVVPGVASIAVLGSQGVADPDKAAPATNPREVARAGGPATWQACARLNGSVGSSRHARFSQDGRKLLTIGADDTLRLWDTANWKLLGQYDIHKRYGDRWVVFSSFSPDGRLCSMYGSIPDPKRPGQWLTETTVLEATTGREAARLPGGIGMFSPDGSCLVTWTSDALSFWTPVFWDPLTFRKKFDAANPPPAWKLHSMPFFSKDGSLLCVSGMGGQPTCVWETATGKERFRPRGFFPDFDRQAKSLLTRLPGGDIKIWDTATGRERTTIRGLGDISFHAELSPDGQHVLTMVGSRTGMRIKEDGDVEFLKGGPASSFQIHPVDIRLWDATTGAELVRLPGMNLLGNARFSPDGKTVAYTRLEPDENEREEMVLWDIAAAKERAVLRAPAGIESCQFSPDGKSLFTNGPSGSDLEPRDPSTGRRLSDLPGKVNAYSLQFSPDGWLLAGAPGQYGSGGIQPVDLLIFRLSDQPLPPPVKRSSSAADTPVASPEIAEEPGGTSATRAMAGLQKDSDATLERLYASLQKVGTDEERKPLQQQITERLAAFVDRALSIARENPADPAAIQALEFALRQTGNGATGALGKLGSEALALVRARFLQSPDITAALYFISYQYTEPAYQLLADIAKRSPHAVIRGRAAYILGNAKAKDAEDVRMWRAAPEFFDHGEVQHPNEVTARLQKSDPDVLEREATRWYTLVKEGYPGVLLPESDPSANLGELADRGLFALQHLTLGKVAPDIAGEDLDVKPFKLSEYRGKVVVLIFCGNWCAPCRAMNPQKQQLIERLAGKPFALVEVNSDQDREAVRRTMRKEKLTWRCWFDGSDHGPIACRWNVHRWPTIFVLDTAGVIRYRDLRDKQLAEVVDKLMHEADGVNPKESLK